MTKKDFIKAYIIGGFIGAVVITTLFHFNAATATTPLHVYIPPFIIGIIVGILGSNSLLLRIVMRELREEKYKAEEATRLKSSFLANMSHEIRTPMNAIIGFTHILGKSTLTKDQQIAQSSIQSASKSLLTIVNDVLDFSKIESGKLDIQYAPFNFITLLNDIYTTFKQSSDEKKLNLQLNYPKTMPPIINLDEVRIRQIMINLVSNAIKFTKEGSVLINIDYQKKSNDKADVRIEVIDSGKGIPDDQKIAIFEPFSQTEGQSTKLYGGTGLGLSISMKLASLMKGTLAVRDNIPHGTIFSLQFNAIECKEAGSEPLDDTQEISIPRLDGKVILLADDIATNRLLISMQLQSSGCRIIEAVNGKEAVEMYHKYNPDLVLMDIRMPVKDGLEATKEIRDKVSDPVPIIALSADVLNKNHYGTELFDDFLSKPINFDDLNLILGKYL